MGDRLRTFGYSDFGGRVHKVEAHYVQFMPQHVTFWTMEEGKPDTLVFAQINTQVITLEEVT